MSDARRSSRAGARAAVVGGGLAGMAAALALAENGCQVDLFEQKRRLGGRAGSVRDPHTGELVDYCMHVSMGCCTNFLDFIRRTGVEDCFDRHRRLTFIGPEGEICEFTSWPWLPAPFHLLPGFARLRYLSLRDRVTIGGCLMRLGLLTAAECRDKSTGQWLRQQGQSRRAIERFWSVVLVSALGETVDRTELSMARKVFLDGFMRSAHGYELLLPRLPLGEIFNGRVACRLRELGVNVHLAAQVQSIELAEDRAETLVLAGGRRLSFDTLVVAVPWTTIGRVFSPEQRSRLHPDWTADRLQSSAITAVHLWFDREITSLPHAAFVGRTSHWIFRSSRSGTASANSTTSHRYQVVISASGQLAHLPNADLLEEVLSDLGDLLPATRSAQLLHHRIVTERNAVFSITPEGRQSRLQAATGIPNVYLAGDWTQSGWPATMEGAILSGYTAAGMVLRYSGKRFLLPAEQLKPGWLARILFPRR